MARSRLGGDGSYGCGHDTGIRHCGCASVMLESPVGSGKTYMALETIHALQELMGRKLKVDWVAPRRHLLRQVMEANKDLHQDNIRPVTSTHHSSKEMDFAFFRMVMESQRTVPGA